MNANDIMTVQTQTCSCNDNLDQVARQMWEHDCGAIPVVDEDRRPVGIITDRDIAIAAMLNHKALWELHAGEMIAHQQVHTCYQDDPVEDCLKLMQAHSIRRLPVTDASGRVAGIISIGDAIAVTGNSAALSKSNQQLSPKHIMAMLKVITAHHASQAGPVAVQQ